MQRVVGADVARGLAVIGMFTAHLGSSTPAFWTSTGWLQVADGRSAATFAFLAGLSAALLSGGPTPRRGAAMSHSRVRVLTRAALLWPIGAAMIALGTPVAVILPGYAVMFALTAVALTWPPRALAAVAAGFALVGPPVVLALRDALAAPDGSLPQVVDVVVGEYYPAGVWMAYLLVGLAVGRTDLHAPRVPLRLAAWGLGCAVVGYGTAAVAMRLLDVSASLPRDLLTSEPHADTVTEVVGNIGVTLLVLAGAIALARRAPRLVAPVAATGALALTAYCTHLVAIALLGPAAVFEPSNARLLAFVVVTLAATTAWRALVGRGPLENPLHLVSTWVADTLVPSGRPAGRRGAAAASRAGSGAGEDLPVQHGEPAVVAGAPGAPRLGERLQGDVVREAVPDGLPREVRHRDPLGPQT